MKTRWHPVARAMLLGLVWLLQTGAATVGSPIASKSAEARQRYEQGDFDEALRLYRDAQLEDPHSPLLHFNVGDALFKLADYPGAQREFESALATQDPVLRESTLYNMGNTYFQQQQFAPAVEAYKQALDLGPENLDAKANLELALQQLEQQQQEQQQQQQQEQREQEREQDGEQGEPQDARSEREEQREPPDEGEQETRQQQPQEPSGAQEQQRPAGEPDEGMAPEEAERILLGLKDQEKDAQVRRFKATVQTRGKDW